MDKNVSEAEAKAAAKSKEALEKAAPNPSSADATSTQPVIVKLEQSQFDALLKALAKTPNEAALEPQLKDLFEAFEQ